MGCLWCGGELTSVDFEGMCFLCRSKLNLSKSQPSLGLETPPYDYSYQQGWVCPKCGNVYAPFISECRVCNFKNNTEVTCLNEGDKCCE